MIDNPRIIICYNEPERFYSNYIGKEIKNSAEDVDLSESEFIKEIKFIESGLAERYEQVYSLPLNHNLESFIQKVRSSSPDVIFNFVEAVGGISNHESYIAGLFDLFGIQYTGNTSLCLGNCLDKLRTKRILAAHNIRIPAYTFAKTNRYFKESEFNIKFPVIIKLMKEDASIGISELSVVHNLEDLNKRLKFLFDNYNQDVLIEEYIKGREINVSILGREILPISEIKFNGLPKDLPKIITYEAKWSPNSIYYNHTVPVCPAVLDDKISNRIKDDSLKAFDAMGCRDYARVDIRLDKRNIPYVIEVNPNPDLSTDSGFVRSAAHAGISHKELMLRLADFALSRIKHD